MRNGGGVKRWTFEAGFGPLFFVLVRPFLVFRILRKENTPRIRVGYMYGAWEVHGTPLQERLDVNKM